MNLFVFPPHFPLPPTLFALLSAEVSIPIPSTAAPRSTDPLGGRPPQSIYHGLKCLLEFRGIELILVMDPCQNSFPPWPNPSVHGRLCRSASHVPPRPGNRKGPPPQRKRTLTALQGSIVFAHLRWRPF